MSQRRKDDNKGDGKERQDQSQHPPTRTTMSTFNDIKSQHPEQFPIFGRRFSSAERPCRADRPPVYPTFQQGSSKQAEHEPIIASRWESSVPETFAPFDPSDIPRHPMISTSQVSTTELNEMMSSFRFEEDAATSGPFFAPLPDIPAPSHVPARSFPQIFPPQMLPGEVRGQSHGRVMTSAEARDATVTGAFSGSSGLPSLLDFEQHLDQSAARFYASEGRYPFAQPIGQLQVPFGLPGPSSQTPDMSLEGPVYSPTRGFHYQIYEQSYNSSYGPSQYGEIPIGNWPGAVQIPPSLPSLPPSRSPVPQGIPRHFPAEPGLGMNTPTLRSRILRNRPNHVSPTQRLNIFSPQRTARNPIHENIPISPMVPFSGPTYTPPPATPKTIGSSLSPYPSPQSDALYAQYPGPSSMAYFSPMQDFAPSPSVTISGSNEPYPQFPVDYPSFDSIRHLSFSGDNSGGDVPAATSRWKPMELEPDATTPSQSSMSMDAQQSAAQNDPGAFYEQQECALGLYGTPEPLPPLANEAQLPIVLSDEPIEEELILDDPDQYLNMDIFLDASPDARQSGEASMTP
ncbi:hypothetical protein SCP_0500520 [Sparassis crispa]|uniref:Uncharacterized protein n=1 Tax=Sparassis crispa TaxID=139825 RepID=A0A401GLK6_9APHY|nr:hypothetical protein SCP_0500520 [Sparassis crispa]GBE83009.1 hypothetical protein SCP_0500520 [Sparassis crispa]